MKDVPSTNSSLQSDHEKDWTCFEMATGDDVSCLVSVDVFSIAVNIVNMIWLFMTDKGIRSKPEHWNL